MATQDHSRIMRMVIVAPKRHYFLDVSAPQKDCIAPAVPRHKRLFADSQI
jgi:hypothetical protein